MRLYRVLTPGGLFGDFTIWAQRLTDKKTFGEVGWVFIPRPGNMTLFDRANKKEKSSLRARGNPLDNLHFGSCTGYGLNVCVPSGLLCWRDLWEVTRP